MELVLMTELDSNSRHVGVIIPAYNAKQWIGETVRSVLSQTHHNLQLLVVDDGSTDGTFDYAARATADDSRARVHRIVNGGTSHARNTGASLCREAEFLLFLDHDDLLIPNAIRTLVEVLLREPSCIAAHGMCGLIDSHGAVINECWRWQYDQAEDEARKFRADTPRMTDLAMFGVRNAIATTGQVLIPAEEFAREQFNPRYPIVQDWDLWRRLARHGPMAMTAETVLFHRKHPQSAGSNRDQTRQDRVSMQRNTAGAGFSPSQIQLLNSMHRSSERRRMGVLTQEMKEKLRRGAWSLAVKSALGAMLSGLQSIRGVPTIR